MLPFEHGDDCPCAPCFVRLLLAGMAWVHDVPIRIWARLFGAEVAP